MRKKDWSTLDMGKAETVVSFYSKVTVSLSKDSNYLNFKTPAK